jgi:hypothetical protein
MTCTLRATPATLHTPRAPFSVRFVCSRRLRAPCDACFRAQGPSARHDADPDAHPHAVAVKRQDTRESRERGKRKRGKQKQKEKPTIFYARNISWEKVMHVVKFAMAPEVLAEPLNDSFLEPGIDPALAVPVTSDGMYDSIFEELRSKYDTMRSEVVRRQSRAPRKSQRWRAEPELPRTRMVERSAQSQRPGSSARRPWPPRELRPCSHPPRASRTI